MKLAAKCRTSQQGQTAAPTSALCVLVIPSYDYFAPRSETSCPVCPSVVRLAAFPPSVRLPTSNLLPVVRLARFLAGDRVLGTQVGRDRQLALPRHWRQSRCQEDVAFRGRTMIGAQPGLRPGIGTWDGGAFGRPAEKTPESLCNDGVWSVRWCAVPGCPSCVP